MNHILASTLNTFLSEVLSETCTTYTKLPRDAVSCSWKFNLAIDYFVLHSVHWKTVFLSLCCSSTAFPTEDLSSTWKLKLTLNYTHSNLQQLTALWFICPTEIHCTGDGEKGLWCMQQVRRESKQLLLAFTAPSPKCFIWKQLLSCLYGKISDNPHCHTTSFASGKRRT